MLSKYLTLILLSLFTLVASKSLPLSKPGMAGLPVQNSPYVHVFYYAPTYTKNSSACLDVDGKIILTKSFFDTKCPPFSSTDNVDGTASHIYNSRGEICGFDSAKLFGCGIDRIGANFTYEGDLFVPILLIDPKKSYTQQNLRSKEVFTNIAEWTPDPIMNDNTGDIVYLAWGRY